MLRLTTLAVAAILLIALPSGRAQGLSAAEAEASKCQDRIAAVKREIMGKYEDALAELQTQFQKAADLDGALAIRAERDRMKKEQILTEGQFVQEPKGLRALQQQHVARMRELIAALVGETIPRLVELKKSLTIAGKLDEAVAVRTAIERLQNDHLPISKPDAGSVVPAETLITSYSADRTRADKTYKGQKITVRGLVGGFRADPNETGSYLVYLTRPGGVAAGWVQCSFNGSGFRCREDKQFNATTLVITDNDRAVVARVLTGQTIDIRGVCEGFEDTVRLTKCEIPR